LWGYVTEADATGSLAGRRVLITRAPHQASELAERLRKLGAETILIPTIEIVPPVSFAALDEALARIADFDLVAFTSANAVRAFGQRAEELELRATPRRIAAVGPATARAAEGVGLRVDVIPPIYTAESLAETLLPEVRGQRILLVLAETAPKTLENALAHGGAQVTVAAVYVNRIPPDSLAAMRELFEGDVAIPHAVTFTSASTASNLLGLLDAAGLTLPESVARVSIGPITSLALRRLGIPAHIEAAASNIDALVAAVAMELRSRP
jgi:uroporphyrinogen-III synthase